MNENEVWCLEVNILNSEKYFLHTEKGVLQTQLSQLGQLQMAIYVPQMLHILNRLSICFKECYY